MLHRCQPCNFHMNIASRANLPSPLALVSALLCQTRGEICLCVVTERGRWESRWGGVEGEGGVASTACSQVVGGVRLAGWLAEIEAFLSAR